VTCGPGGGDRIGGEGNLTSMAVAVSRDAGAGSPETVGGVCDMMFDD
jgi:hypothetical protein